MDGKCLEMWMPGLGVYAELLDDTIIQALRKGKLPKESSIIKSPGVMPGFLVHSHTSYSPYPSCV